MLTLCSVCEKPSSQVCTGCRAVTYCSVDHQKIHWKKHKPHCRLFVVKKDEQYGRYLVASRDIPQGAVIIDEFPIMVGPKQDTLPICLGCHQKILCPTNQIHYCSICNTFPMCGPSCESMRIHVENECSLFSQHKAPFRIKSLEETHPAYESVFTLRCLLLKKHDPKKWQQLTKMESQNENRMKLTSIWHRNQVNIVKFLRNNFALKSEFSEEEVHSVIGYADINSFEIKSKTQEICGVYNNAYLMVHDCISNTHHVIGEDFRMTVRASVPIKKGDKISTIYTHTLEGTLRRRSNLRESKFFDCTCKRCTDPTELGTYFSALKCSNCNSGYQLPNNPLDINSVWGCSHCLYILAAEEVEKLLKSLEAEMEVISESAKTSGLIPPLENFISRHSGITLHPNHYLLMKPVHTLSELYGRVRGWHIDDLSLDILMRKEHHCLHLLSTIDVIDPGLSRLRGVTLYELHAAIFFIARMKFEKQEICVEELKQKLEKVISLLNQAEEILLFDPPNSTEAIIAASIPQSIEGVKVVMNHFCFNC